jgi:hypothetical protein
VSLATGSDSVLCGISSSSACGTFEYAFTNRLDTINGTLYIVDGTHPVNNRTFQLSVVYTLTFEGSGFEPSAAESSYPTIYLSSTSAGNWMYIQGSNVSQSLIFRKLRLMHMAGFNSWWFSPTQSQHTFLFEHCYFVENVTGTVLSSAIFSHDYGLTMFHDMGKKILYFLSFFNIGNFSLKNCTFYGQILGTGNPIYHMYNPSATLTKAEISGCHVSFFLI